MPEGDTVARTARRLHAALSGARLTAAELRVPRHATARLAGALVVEVVSRGKHLLLRVADGPGSEPERTLHTHLGMEGRWLVRAAGARLPGRSGTARVVLITERVLAIGDRLARVDLVPTEREDTLVGHLGPDLLGEDWDADEAVRRLTTQPDRAIGEALLDQRNLAGIGNLYRAELLFLRGVAPTSPVSEVDDLHAMVGLARRLLLANIDRAEQTTTGDTRRGRRTHVYRREGQPCRRCGTRVLVDSLPDAVGSGADAVRAERFVWWCPHCQPRWSHK